MKWGSDRKNSLKNVTAPSTASRSLRPNFLALRRTRPAKQLCPGDWVKKTGWSIHPRNGPQKTPLGPGHLWGRWGQTPTFANAGNTRWSTKGLILVPIRSTGAAVCRVEEELSSRLQFYKRSARRKIQDSHYTAVSDLV